jgi:N6-L-threonylcarbamoyladenine synthase
MSISDGLILGIETSCDETAAAVVDGGISARSSVVASQERVHAMFGGVVPEIASRKHAEALTGVVEAALRDAGVGWDDLDGIGVTNGPGLIGSLLVGVSAAKAYHAATGLPLVGVNHLHAHVAANFADICPNPISADALPAMCLVVSGGHTDIVMVRHQGDYQVLAATVDDAAGEAFDKAARVLGLAYPGGPAVAAAAESGDPTAYDLPRPRVGETLDFSFSGLKTALVRQLQDIQGIPLSEQPSEPEGGLQADLAASFQDAVVDTLVRNTMEAVGDSDVEHLAIAGGVAANRLLRGKLADACTSAGVEFHRPPPELCTDNAVMIAMAAAVELGRRAPDNLSLGVFSAMAPTSG